MSSLLEDPRKRFMLLSPPAFRPPDPLYLLSSHDTPSTICLRSMLDIPGLSKLRVYVLLDVVPCPHLRILPSLPRVRTAPMGKSSVHPLVHDWLRGSRGTFASSGVLSSQRAR